MPEIDLDRPRPKPPGSWTAEQLAARFPRIPWRRPLKVVVMGVEGDALVCRVCVANSGLRAQEVAALLGGRDPRRRATLPYHLTEESFDEHMLEAHPEPDDPTLPPGAVPRMPALRRPPGV